MPKPGEPESPFSERYSIVFGPSPRLFPRQRRGSSASLGQRPRTPILRSTSSLKAVKEARSKDEGRRPGSTAAGRRSERERSESLPCTVTDSLSCRPEMNTSGSLTEQQAVGPAQIDRSEAKGTPHSTHSRSCTDRSAFHPGTWNSELLPPVSRSPWNVER